AGGIMGAVWVAWDPGDHHLLLHRRCLERRGSAGIAEVLGVSLRRHGSQRQKRNSHPDHAHSDPFVAHQITLSPYHFAATSLARTQRPLGGLIRSRWATTSP